MGSLRPARPAQLSPGVVDNLAGGADPQAINDMSHASAAALLDRVHHTQDPEVVRRVLTLVDTEGVDIIAGLWSDAEPDSLPGILWRLYLLRTWCGKNRESIARLWKLGEPVATTASAIAGVDQAPTEEDIARTADSILSGAFTGDFAIALDRASSFTIVVAGGLHVQARRMARDGDAREELDPLSEQIAEKNSPGRPYDAHTAAARILHTASNLETTSRHFHHAAGLWRAGKLE
ncbi:MAG: hypothetical protein LKI88_02270 [Bifidobacterium sp.]|nr:hypothetical protein [Bifidobacterium sp.]MCI1864750.1 hypothetical protein [Bifidobacterium sp.]